MTYSRKPRIGMQIQDVEEGKGVTVKDVDDESPASKAGMKEGDVITQVNGKEIAGVEELRTEIKDIKEGDTLKVAYKRGGKNQTAEIKIPKRLKTANL
jgi:serine protease Do